MAAWTGRRTRPQYQERSVNARSEARPQYQERSVNARSEAGKATGNAKLPKLFFNNG